MKTAKRPQHCAHVASYYVHGVGIWLDGLERQVLGRNTKILQWLKYATAEAKLAMKFWKLAGGAS